MYQTLNLKGSTNCTERAARLLTDQPYRTDYKDCDKDQKKSILNESLSLFSFEQARQSAREFNVLLNHQVFHLRLSFLWMAATIFHCCCNNQLASTSIPKIHIFLVLHHLLYYHGNKRERKRPINSLRLMSFSSYTVTPQAISS